MLTQARLVLLAALLIAGSMFLGACAPSEKSPAADKGAGPSEVGTPKRGGILRISNGGNSWHTMDPAIGQTPWSLWYMVGAPMIYRDIETWELKAAVIESWDVSKDSKEVILHVRKGVKFHNKPPANGREVEARDVVYTLKGVTGQLYPQLPEVRFPTKSDIDAMVDAEVVDKYTVKVTLSRPSSSFFHGMAHYRSTYVVPEGLREHFGGVEALYDASTLVERAVGSGPYIPKKIENLIETVFERNPDYWEEGKPYFDAVRGVWVPDSSTEMAAFAAGQLDYKSISTADDRDFVLRSSKDAVIRNYESSCWYRMDFNNARKPFDDYRVRKAIALVVDHKKLGEAMAGTWEGQPMWRYPAPVTYPHPEALSQEELAQHPIYRGPTPENVAEARRLLKEAGYENGFTFEIMYSKHAIIQDAPIIIKEDIERNLPGLKIKLTPLDAAVNFKRAVDGDFDVQHYCHVLASTGVIQMQQAYHSKGARNYGSYKDPVMDALLERADAELDLNKRKEIMRQAQYKALETVGKLPTVQLVSMMALQPWLKGVHLGGGNTIMINSKDWWFDPPPKR